MCTLQIKTPKFVSALMLADAIQTYGGGELTVTGPTATAGIFSTYPADYLSMWGGIVDQVAPRHRRTFDHLQPCVNTCVRACR